MINAAHNLYTTTLIHGHSAATTNNGYRYCTVLDIVPADSSRTTRTDTACSALLSFFCTTTTTTTAQSCPKLLFRRRRRIHNDDPTTTALSSLGTTTKKDICLVGRSGSRFDGRFALARWRWAATQGDRHGHGTDGL
jgi:hypothetical protein